MFKVNKSVAEKVLQLRATFSGSINQFRTITHATTIKQENAHTHVEWNVAKPFKSIPGPGVMALLTRFLPGGKYHDIQLGDLHRSLRAEYGDLVKFPGLFGNKGVVFSYLPSDFEHMFRHEGIWPLRRGMATFQHYRQHFHPELFAETGGLLNEQGEKWAQVRSIVGPIMMKPANVDAYIPSVDEIAIEFVQVVDKLRDKNMEVPATFDFELRKWALESVCFIALDHRLNIVRGDQRDSRATDIIKAVDDFVNLSYELEMKPSPWRFIATANYKKLMQSYDTITNTSMFFIENTIAKLENHVNETSGDANHQKSVLEKILKTDKQIAVVMAIDMMLAGVDTTSSTLSSCLFYLSRNPEKQRRLREELKAIPVDSNGMLTPQSFRSAPYLSACLKESMRLAPVVAGNVRQAIKDMVIQGYQIPNGTDVAMGNIIVMREEQHFCDGNQFLPERWLKANHPEACPSKKASNPFVYLPFGFGPRSCIGKRLAMMEMNIVLKRLLEKYHVEYHYEDLKYRNGFILSPINELKFRFIDV